MRYRFLGLAIAAGLIMPVLGQQASGRERLLDQECRRELVRLCGMDRAKLRACLRERHDELSDNCKVQLIQAMEKRRGGAAGLSAKPKDAQPITYGSDTAQTIDLYLPTSARPANGYPLLVYVHGGGWRNGDRSMVQEKPAFANDLGWAFASVGYRLLPNAPVEQQGQDVADAVRKLAADARLLGIDPGRIVLMGHSAGAHLSALVATDPGFLGAQMGRLAGIILLDGAAYDVARQMRDQPMLSNRLYLPAFGTDPVRQARLSPLTHAAAPNAPRWLILFVARRADAAAQSDALAKALTASGAEVRLKAIEGESHMTINRELGAADNAHSAEVGAFLKTS